MARTKKDKEELLKGFKKAKDKKSFMRKNGVTRTQITSYNNDLGILETALLISLLDSGSHSHSHEEASYEGGGGDFGGGGASSSYDSGSSDSGGGGGD